MPEGSAAASAATSYAYKVIGGCEIGADVYRPRSPSGAGVMWLHGGALMMGNRGWINHELVRMLNNAGVTVASVDYRLAPETLLPEIAGDIEYAWAWLAGQGTRLFGLDPARLAVMGQSAGGYLTLLSGHTLVPWPRVLVSFYGYGDIVGDWYTKPSPFYAQMAPVSHEEAWALVGDPPICQSGEERFPLYLHCRQLGIWPRVVSGRDPAQEPGFFRRYSPLHNVGHGYPPTLLLHGDEDTDVPHEQSLLMAEALSRAGVEHRLITIGGGGHGFDDEVQRPAVRVALHSAVAFLSEHLGV